MQMWIDFVLDGDVGVSAEFIFDEVLNQMSMHGGFEEPYPTIYVFLPVFGTSKFGESCAHIFAPMFYHVDEYLDWIDLVLGHAERHKTNVSMTVIVEARD